MTLSLRGIGEFKIILATSQMPGLNLTFLSHSKLQEWGILFHFWDSEKKKIERFSGFLKNAFVKIQKCISVLSFPLTFLHPKILNFRSFSNFL